MSYNMKLISALVLGVSLAMSGSATARADFFVKKLNFQPDKNKSTFVVEFGGTTVPVVQEDARIRQLVIELPGVQLPSDLTRVIDFAAKDSPVVQITPYNAGAPVGGAKIVLQLREQVDISKESSPGKLTLRLRPLSATIVKRAMPASSDADLRVDATDEKLQVSSNNNSKRIELTKAWIESDAIHESSSASDKTDHSIEVAKKLEETLNSNDADKSYQGSKVNFEASDSDVHDIFRLVAATSGLNILTASDVVGKVSLSLKGIPWDQLLDVILQQQQLRIAVSGNVVRVMSQAAYNKELDERKKSLALTTAMEPTIMAILPISYAKADEMKRMIDTLLIHAPAATMGSDKESEQAFERGKLEVDQRSNSLIVTNTSKAIERIKRLLKELDVAMPQILIESKIVVASETFSRGLGLNWAAQQAVGAAGTAGGGLSFNGGKTNTTAVTSTASTAASSTFAVASNANSGAFGFALGAGSRANLAVSLAMAESSSLAKTVASPKIIVGNKQSASITDTLNAAYTTQSTSTGGVATETKFVSLPLTMTVNPQITNAGSVLMDLSVSKSSLHDAKSGASEQKSIQTQVLVDSGSTLVLGGVYQYQTNKDRDGVPFLKDLPVLGFLFRNSLESESKSELLVFVTPKILDTGNSGVSNQM